MIDTTLVTAVALPATRSSRLRAWLGQKTTITGIATLAGDVGFVLTGATTWQVELPIAIGAVVAMALPEKAAIVQPTVALARDALSAILTHDPREWELVIADAQAEAAALGYGAGQSTSTPPIVSRPPPD